MHFGTKIATATHTSYVSDSLIRWILAYFEYSQMLASNGGPILQERAEEKYKTRAPNSLNKTRKSAHLYTYS